MAARVGDPEKQKANMQAKSTSNATYQANYHLVFCPKYRRQILVGAVATRLAELLSEIAKKWGLQIINFNERQPRSPANSYHTADSASIVRTTSPAFTKS